MHDPIKILIVSPLVLVREGAAHVLRDAPEFLVAGQAATVQEALQIAAEARPDMLITDYDIPPRNGPWLVECIKGILPNLRALMLSEEINASAVLSSLESGAEGFIHTRTSAEEFRRAVRLVAAGRSYVNGAVQHLFSGWLRHDTPVRLTEHEEEILALVLAGLGPGNIAPRLALSPTAVRASLRGLYDKFEVSKLSQLLALRVNHVRPPKSLFAGGRAR